MSHLNKDKLMNRYLLGESFEPEEIELEERFFADDDYFEQLLAVEDELIDAYVRGELSARQREQFESRYLTTPQRCQRVKFAKNLMRAVSGTPARVSPAPTTARHEGLSSWSGSVLDTLRGRNLGWQTALAAAVVAVLLGGLWLAMDLLRRERTAPEPRGAERVALGRQETQQRADQQSARNDDGLSKNAQQRQSERAPTNRQQPKSGAQASNHAPQTGKSARPKQSRPTIASLVLTPGLVREAGESNRLIIPPGPSSVRLVLNLEYDAYTSYRAVLQTAEGAQLWSQAALRAQLTKAGKTIVLRVPASLLTKGDYILTLSGITIGGNSEVIDEYSFRLVSR